MQNNNNDNKHTNKGYSNTLFNIINKIDNEINNIASVYNNNKYKYNLVCVLSFYHYIIDVINSLKYQLI